MTSIPQDLTGRCFGRWTVVEFSHIQIRPSGKGCRYWVCRCDCGTERPVTHNSLQSNKSSSCGCLQKQIASKIFYKHGYTNSRTYSTWAAMIQRTCNPLSDSYPSYGGSGINVCDRWHTFSNFLNDMGEYPSDEHSIDRFPDHSGNYTPSNTRWATNAQQSRNKCNNRNITINGETMCMTDWSDAYGMNRSVVDARISKYGWNPFDALTVPSKPGTRLSTINKVLPHERNQRR